MDQDQKTKIARSRLEAITLQKIDEVNERIMQGMQDHIEGVQNAMPVEDLVALFDAAKKLHTLRYDLI